MSKQLTSVASLFTTGLWPMLEDCLVGLGGYSVPDKTERFLTMNRPVLTGELLVEMSRSVD